MLLTEAMYFLIHCLFRNLWNADDPYVYAGAHVSVPKGLTSILHQVAQVCAHGMRIQHLLNASTYLCPNFLLMYLRIWPTIIC